MKILILVLSFNMILFAQQDPNFTLASQIPVVYNPAYNGNEQKINVGLIYRKQWVNAQINPTFNLFSIDMPFKSKKIGVGGYVLREDLGVENKLSICLNYAYKINFAKGNLAFGLGGGFIQYRLNLSKLQIKDLDDQILLNTGTAYLPDINAGLLYTRVNTCLGYSITHLNQPALSNNNSILSLSKIHRHHYITFSQKFILSPKFINKTFLLSRFGKNFFLLDFGSNFEFKESFKFGLGYRTNKTMYLQGGFLVGNLYKLLQDFYINYAFEFPIISNKLSGYYSHEIMIRGLLDFPKNIKRIKNKNRQTPTIEF